MKTLWMILIGMVLFNGFLLAFDSAFPQSPMSSGLYDVENVTHNETFSAYKKPGSITPAILIGGIDLLAITVGGVMSFLTRDLKFIACGGLVALISTCWTASASVFGNMMNSFSNNPILPAIFTLISVTIGICVALLILGILTSQEQLQ